MQANVRLCLQRVFCSTIVCAFYYFIRTGLSVTGMSTVSTRYRLLFIDNNEKILRELNAIFRRDCDIFLASKAADAFDILSYQQIDVVVIDRYMPLLRGGHIFDVTAISSKCLPIDVRYPGG